MAFVIQSPAQAVPESCAGDGCRPRRRAGVPAFPAGAVTQDLEHQPARAAQRRTERGAQRSCPSNGARTWSALPQRRCDNPLGGQPAAGAAGGMTAGASALLLRGHHGQNPGTRGAAGIQERRPG